LLAASGVLRNGLNQARRARRSSKDYFRINYLQTKTLIMALQVEPSRLQAMERNARRGKACFSIMLLKIICSITE
jgi:hypothetical protein